jgi:hypothetical protein
MYSVTKVRLQPRGTQLISNNLSFYTSTSITAHFVTACLFKQCSYCHQPRAVCVQVGLQVRYSTTSSNAEIYTVGHGWTKNKSGALVEWYWLQDTEEPGDKPMTVPLRPQQIPHGMRSDWNRAFTPRGRRLTTWAVTWPPAAAMFESLIVDGFHEPKQSNAPTLLLK